MYLRQQRRQLDESRRLLERLEHQQQQQGDGSIPTSFHIHTAGSGTLPSMTTPTHRHSTNASASGADMQGHVGPTRVVTMGTQAGAGAASASGGRNGAKMDLSSLYEQCKQRREREREISKAVNIIFSYSIADPFITC